MRSSPGASRKEHRRTKLRRGTAGPRSPSGNPPSPRGGTRAPPSQRGCASAGEEASPPPAAAGSRRCSHEWEVTQSPLSSL
eukprot:15633859-Heterocapsa_arctica.AAC.1